jgi:hypothetical protein
MGQAREPGGDTIHPILDTQKMLEDGHLSPPETQPTIVELHNGKSQLPWDLLFQQDSSGASWVLWDIFTEQNKP